MSKSELRENIEIITTKQGAHPIKFYPFSRDGIAYRCKLCEKIWLLKKDANFHICFPKDE